MSDRPGPPYQSRRAWYALLQWVTTVLFALKTPPAVISGTSTETSFAGTETIKGGTFKAGRVYRFKVLVSFPSTNATDTATIKLKIGSVVIASLPATDVANGDSAMIDMDLVIRTEGRTGTIFGSGMATIGTPGTATVKHFVLSQTTLNTILNNLVDVTCQWSSTNAGNQARLDQYSIQEL